MHAYIAHYAYAHQADQLTVQLEAKTLKEGLPESLAKSLGANQVRPVLRATFIHIDQEEIHLKFGVDEHYAIRLYKLTRGDLMRISAYSALNPKICRLPVMGITVTKVRFEGDVMIVQVPQEVRPVYHQSRERQPRQRRPKRAATATPTPTPRGEKEAGVEILVHNSIYEVPAAVARFLTGNYRKVG